MFNKLIGAVILVIGVVIALNFFKFVFIAAWGLIGILLGLTVFIAAICICVYGWRKLKGS